MPTSPYGVSPPGDEPSLQAAEGNTGFFVTAEAAPLLPPAKDESRVQPVSSLTPLALSTPPVATDDGAEGPSSLGLLWSRRRLIVGAAVAAFVMSAAVGRLTVSSRASARVLSAAAQEPASAAPVAPAAAPEPEVTATLVVASAPPAPIASEEEVTEPGVKPRVRHPARARRSVRVAVRPTAKRPFMPDQI